MYRVAVASTDGKVVNQHFGRASEFHIFDLDTEHIQAWYVGTRATDSCCHGGEHGDSAFDNAFKVLGDVSAVLVSKIGHEASDYLESKGIVPYQAPFAIEPLFRKIFDDKLYEVDKWQYHMTN